MELFQLRYFVAAARALHFSKAAEALYVSQPSLSLQIGKLEAELGTPLFHRRGRRVTLTDAGRTLLPLAERILDQEAEARRAVQQVAGLERGRLSICALPALDQHLLPPWLARFRREHPGIEIRVWEERPAAAVAEAVRQGHADLGFLQLPCDTTGLGLRVLLEDPILLVVPEGHPFAGRAAVALEEAAGEDWVWVHEAQGPDHPLYAACLRAGSPREWSVRAEAPRGFWRWWRRGSASRCCLGWRWSPGRGRRPCPWRSPPPGRSPSPGTRKP